MQQRKLVACVASAVLALAIGCSNDPESPVSPTSTSPGDSSAGPNGETLKATAPSPQAPINNAQPDTLTLTTGKAQAAFAPGNAAAYSYEFEIRNASGSAAVCPSVTVPGGSGTSVSASPVCSLDFDQSYSWRVRAVFNNAAGPWSANATFRAPAGGYIRGNEVMDPLTNGRTAGDISGPTTFLPGQGLRLNDHSSFVTYRLPQNLQEGEFSMMVLNADEGNPGDKSKIMSMQEGPNIEDITTDDYRATVELRGRNYGAPGAVTFRMIPGDGEITDAHRQVVSFSSSLWYFWRFSWNVGSARLEVKEGGPNGRVLFDQAHGTSGHPYRPDPHYLHLGAPMGRAGFLDATMPGIIIKNVWASSRPRPAFPGE